MIADARSKLKDARLYLLLTRNLCTKDPALVLRESLRGGVQVVQVREKLGADKEWIPWFQEVRAITASHGALMIVNDRANLASLVQADGVHVGQGDENPQSLRARLGSDLLIGLSTHGASDVLASQTQSIDYLGVGPVFDTATKGLTGRGLDLIPSARQHARVPFFAIGGIRLENLDHVLASGAERVAVCGALCSAEDPSATARAFSDALMCGGMP
ncbi:MAG TPA: thiamine phosphate synthase [Planctomycetota bacterium]|nr:thiamine phosphate synthase [Planctomycetota bacterium]